MTHNVRQIAWLDSYHRDVRAALLPLLDADRDGDDVGWLLRHTLPLREFQGKQGGL